MTRSQLAPHHGMGMDAGGRVIRGKCAQAGLSAQAIGTCQRAARREATARRKMRADRAARPESRPDAGAHAAACGTELIRPSV